MLRKLVSQKVVICSTSRMTPVVRSSTVSLIRPSFVFHPHVRTLSSLAEPDQSLFDVNRPSATNNPNDLDKQLRSDVKSMGLILGTRALILKVFAFYSEFDHHLIVLSFTLTTTLFLHIACTQMNCKRSHNQAFRWERSIR